VTGEVSVVLAACNGSLYLREQVESILPQLHEGDQLILSVDPSTDGTCDLACGLAAADSRIVVLQGPGQGVPRNFEQAIAASEGAYVFLSDQDDVWCPHKVAAVRDAFAASGAALVLHDAQVVDQDLEVVAPSFFAQRGSRPGYWRNILKNSYIGCCMAFRRELTQVALPFPERIPMHDQWLGLVGEKNGGVFFLDEPLIAYRRHTANATATTHAGLAQMLAWRIRLVRELRRRSFSAS
jgi:glycosyltransferase involved in cell wall biosynthesis